jgi:hypothetical protein
LRFAEVGFEPSDEASIFCLVDFVHDQQAMFLLSFEKREVSLEKEHLVLSQELLSHEGCGLGNTSGNRRREKNGLVIAQRMNDAACHFQTRLAVRSEIISGGPLFSQPL